MTATRISVAVSLTLVASLLSACASATKTGAGTAEPAPSQAGSAPLRRNPFVLTAAEIEATPGLQNALDAVQQLRPHFLRTRGAVSTNAGGLLGGNRTRSTSRGTGQAGQPSESGGTAAEGNTPSMPEDVGILVYLDRQRYGRLNTLREISITTIEEIRFLNVGEATSEFGMGHPHGAIQVISKRGPSDK